MTKENQYTAAIESRDLTSLIALAYDEKASASQDREDLIEALQALISYENYDWSCGKLSPDHFGDEYLQAVLALERLTQKPDYGARNEFYFILLDIKKEASSSQKSSWYAEINKNIEAGLVLNPADLVLLNQKIGCLDLRARETSYADPARVADLLDFTKAAVEQTADDSLWYAWLAAITTLWPSASDDVRALVKKSISDFVAVSQRQLSKRLIDPLSFIEQIGHRDFLGKLPVEIVEKVPFWLHEVIERERGMLSDLPTEKLRNDAMLFLDAYEHYGKDPDVLKHALTLTATVWQREHNWNSLLFFLKAQTLYAFYLKDTGDMIACLDMFKAAKETVDAVVSSLELADSKHFGFMRPLLDFYDAYEKVAPDETQRRALVKEHMQIAASGVVSAGGYHAFPYEHLLACQAYFDMPEAFEKTWIELFIRHYLYVKSVQDRWEQSPFVQKDPALRETFQKTAAYYKSSSDDLYVDFEKQLGRKFNVMTLPALRDTLDAFLAHRHRAGQADKSV